MAKYCFILCFIVGICFGSDSSVRQEIIILAKSYIGVTESTNNRGKEVDQFIVHGGLTPPQPWCGLFVQYIYDSCGVLTPKYPALAASWFAKNITKTPYPGSTVGIYFTKLKGIHHVGILEEINNKDFIYISGNTNDQSSREGDKVMIKRLPLTSNIYFSDWVKTNPDYYIVKPQDTLYRISVNFSISIETLKSLNNLTDNRISVGQKLVLNEN